MYFAYLHQFWSRWNQHVGSYAIIPIWCSSCPGLPYKLQTPCRLTKLYAFVYK